MNPNFQNLVGRLKNILCQSSRDTHRRRMLPKPFSRSSGKLGRWLSLSLYTKSPAAYDDIRGVLRLPSKTTLLDFRYAEKPEFGFHVGLKAKLIKLAHGLKDDEKFVFLTLDEMQINKGLVFDKTTGRIVGFTEYGESHVEEEKQLATHMLGIYIKGIIGSLSMMLAYFPTATARSYHLTSIFWDCLQLLEACGLKMMLICCDGSPNNRKFFTNLLKGSAFDHKFVNPFDQSRHIFLWPDPPHLIKTARNSMLKNMMSSPDGEIRWKHIETVYENITAQHLHQPCKLTDAHVYLSNVSKMSVKLASQVLSASVARILEKSSYHATAKYAQLWNKFFDICNSTSGQGARKNLDMMPFTSIEDCRLTWLKNSFWEYFVTWKASCNKREDFIAAPTFEGLKILVLSIIDLVTYLLSNSTIKFICLARVSQDCLERHFGHQRAVGRRSDNPNALMFGYNEKLIGVQRSIKQIRGNVHCTKLTLPVNPSDEPLPKRCRSRHKKL